MTEMNYAAIDIGSNAARLLVKRIEESETGTKFTKELLLRVPLRLGFDVFGKGKISEKRGKNMMRLMKSYAYLMKIYDVQKYRACATSAMRDAKNGMELIKEIEKKTGIHIEIIGGQEEAQIVYNNHIEYMKDRTGNYLYVDVGGGSTEINLLSQGELKCSRSYNIGTVRLLNKAVKESEWTRLKEDMAELAAQYPDTNIIGSGGNINMDAPEGGHGGTCRPISRHEHHRFGRKHQQALPLSGEEGQEIATHGGRGASRFIR